MEANRTQSAVGKHVILYDGVCGLCNRMNQFVLPRDRKNLFMFASLQSNFAKELLARYGRDPAELDTFYVVINFGLPAERLRDRADAALYVLDNIGGPYKLAGCLRVLPGSLLDWGYNLVAISRYRLFGRHDTCLLPDPKYSDKFIEV